MAGFGLIEQLLGRQSTSLLGGIQSSGVMSQMQSQEFMGAILGNWVQDNAGKALKMALGEIAKQGVMNAIKGGGIS